MHLLCPYNSLHTTHGHAFKAVKNVTLCVQILLFPDAFLTFLRGKADSGGKRPQLELIMNFPDEFFCLYIGPLYCVSTAAPRWVQFHPQSSSFCPSFSLRASSTCSRTDVMQGPGRRVDQSESRPAPKTVSYQPHVSLLVVFSSFLLISTISTTITTEYEY